MDELDLTGATVLSVHPGDQLVLVLSNNLISPEQVDQFKHRLEERVPGVSWTIIGGVEEVIHVPAG